MEAVFAHGFPAQMGLDTGAPGDEPLRRNLDATCSLARALLEQLSIPVAQVFQILGSVPIPILVLEGPNHALRYGNEAWRRDVGYSGPAGVALLEIFPRLAGHALMAAIERVYQTGDNIEVLESPFDNLGSGVPHFYSAAIQAIRDPAVVSGGGGVGIAGVVVAGVDLTAQVLSRQLLSDVLQTLVWSGITAGPGGRYNSRWTEYTGLSADRSNEGGWHQVVHDDDLGSCRQAFDEALARRMATQVEARLRRRDGQYRWHRIRFTFLDTRSDVVRWFGIASDIDDVRRTQEERIQLLARERAARAEAEDANRQKDRFLAVVSHELRTPLGALLLWTKVLQDNPADPEVRRRALAAIQECTNAQSRLVDDLLDISRVISGKLYFDPKLVDVGRVVQAGVDNARPAAAAKMINLEASFEDSVGQVLGDVGRLRQVLDNLLSNAIKFTGIGGRVGVVARHDDEAVEIDVRDNGLGIDADVLPLLFDPFSQGDDSPMTRAHGGLGLGLAIARQLVELQGGTLRAHSDGPGRGATFTIRLPLSHDAASSVPATAGEPVPERLRDVHVLLVDDDPRVREPMGLLLEAEGAKVEYAASAEMAWAALLRDPPQVLVSDVAMPGAGGDGYSLVRRLRTQAPPTLRDLPAVALTAYAREIDRTRALDAGFNMHIPKPVDFDQLVIGIGALSAGHARRRAPVPEPRPKRTRSRAGSRTSET